MAAILTKLNATPCSLSYGIAGDNGAATVRLTANLLADMVDGPLKQKISQLTGHLNTLNVGQPNHGKVRIRNVTGTDITVVNPVFINVHWETTGLSAQSDAGSSYMIEIRFPHSEER